jgi:Radical SAM superfamily
MVLDIQCADYKSNYDVILFTGFHEETVKTFGAHKCAHELRLAGFRTLVINHLHEFNISELKKILLSAVGSNTLFVGFSNTFLQPQVEQKNPQRSIKTVFENFLPHGNTVEQEFADYLHSINPTCKIVLGGTRTFYNIRNPNVDYAVIGYADLSIINLAQHLRDQVPLLKAKRNLNRITVIDDPLADGFDFVNSTMHWCDDDIMVPGERLLLEISRGCIFSCRFCNYRLNGKKNLDYLKHYETIRQELLYNYEKYNVTCYRLLDDTYNDTKEKIDIMLDVVKSLPFKPQFWAYIRLDLMAKHPETIDKLIESGIVHMYFGIETLDKKAGAIIGKGYSAQKQIETIQYIKKTYGDRVFLYGSFICGLPAETKDSVRNTMQKLLSKEIPLDNVYYRPLEIRRKEYETWHSAFGLDMTKYGFREVSWGENNQLTQDVNWESDLMTFLEARKMCGDFMAQWEEPNPNLILPSETKINKDKNFIDIYKKQLFNYLEHN